MSEPSKVQQRLSAVHFNEIIKTADSTADSHRAAFPLKVCQMSPEVTDCTRVQTMSLTLSGPY